MKTMVRTREQAERHLKQEHDRYHKRNWGLLGLTPANASQLNQFKRLMVALLVQESEDRRARKNESYKRYTVRHPEKMKARHVDQNVKFAERILAGHRKRMYGLSREDYAALVLSQEGNCAICESPLGDKFHTDHCHQTGGVRGLLCRGCNIGLGHFKDSEVRLQKAILYLKRPPVAKTPRRKRPLPPRTPEYCAKQSAAKKLHYALNPAPSGENHPGFGKTHTPEAKANMAAAQQQRRERERLAKNE